MTLDDETLQRYYDGDLPPALERSVRAQVDKDPKAQARLAELAKLSKLFKLSAQEWSRDLDSAALFGDVRRALEQRPAPSLGERLQVVIGEFAPRRQKLMISAVGFAAAAAVALALFAPRDEAKEPAGELEARAKIVRERTALAAAVPAARTQVEQVDFGSNTGTVFEVDNEGVTTAVVWIADEEEEGAPAP